MLIVLDSGPLGLVSNPTQVGQAKTAWEWAQAHIGAGNDLVVPEIADYEVRRELIRADKTQGLARLDVLCASLWYEPLTTGVMRQAAQLWAQARNDGLATAHDAALDGDVILAAQALGLQQNHDVTVATTNPAHLGRYVQADIWSDV